MYGANMKIIIRPSVLITNELRVISSTRDNIKTDLKKQNGRMAWTAFVWLRTETRRELLRAR
jgi:hypothetical protein